METPIARPFRTVPRRLTPVTAVPYISSRGFIGWLSVPAWKICTDTFRARFEKITSRAEAPGR